MSHNLDYDHLFMQLKKVWSSGREEIHAMATEGAAELQQMDPQTGDEDYIAYLMDLIGFGGAEYAPFIEPFLDIQRDFLTEHARSLLCGGWGLTEHYLDYIIKFMRGVDWDDWDNIQHGATMAAGHYLEHHEDPRLLSELIRMAEGTSNVDRHPSYPFLTAERREFAYGAIVEALGKAKDERRRRVFTIDEIDPAVIGEAKERLAREESHRGDTAP